MCLWGEGRGVSVGWGKGYRVTCSSSTGNMNDLPYYFDNLRKDEEARWGGGTPLCMHDNMYSILSFSVQIHKFCSYYICTST